jgi:YgiT-type zinc finger domain-containing protein
MERVKCTCGRETTIDYLVMATTYKGVTMTISNVPIDSCSYCDLHYGIAKPSEAVEAQIDILLEEAYQKGLTEMEYKPN